MLRASDGIAAAKKAGGIGGFVARVGHTRGAAGAFLRLMTARSGGEPAAGHRPAGSGLLMAGHVFPVLFVVAAWFVSTGVVIALDRLPPRTFRWSLTGAGVVAVGGAVARAPCRRPTRRRAAPISASPPRSPSGAGTR